MTIASTQKPLNTGLKTAFLAAPLALALMMGGCSDKGSSTVGANEMTLGKPEAKVTIIEYASVACPICATVNESAMVQVKKKYIDTGKAKLVYRPMLTGVPSIAASGELLARCAGKDKYFTVVDTIMRAQGEMYKGGENDTYARPVLVNIAKSLGMSEEKFNTCVTDAKALNELNELNETYITKDKVDGTPTFLINGKKLTGDLTKIETFDKAIEAELK